MCDPVTLGIGIAALTGGTALQSYVGNERQKRANEAADEMYMLERQRQDRYANEQRSLYDQILSETAGRGNVDADMEAAAAERMAMQEQNTALPESADVGYTPSAADNTRNIQARVEQNRAENQERLGQQFGALARLRSLGDTLQQYSLFRQPLVGEMEAIGGFSRQSSQVAPMEAQEAARKAADWGMGLELVGNLASGLGSAAIGAGAFGAGAGAAGAGTGAATTGGSTASAANLFSNPSMFALPYAYGSIARRPMSSAPYGGVVSPF